MKDDVYAIIKGLCGIEDINVEMSLQFDLGFDSLMLITALVEMEEKLNYQFDISELEPSEIQTVGDLMWLATKSEVIGNV